MIVTFKKVHYFGTITTPKKELTKATLKKWRDMTEENYHEEVRYEIAEFFNQCYGNKARALYFKDAIKSIENGTYKNDYFNVALCDVTRGMLEEIKFTCGERVYNLVSSCL